MYRFFQIFGVALALTTLVSLKAHAEHPIEVQKYSANGEHFKALVAFDRLPRRRVTLESRISAARSAWALGLTQRALDDFDSVLSQEGISKEQEAQLQLSKGILEYQELRYRVSMLYAERAIALLETPGALRARAWLLWGDAHSALKAYGAAIQKFEKALEEAEPAEIPDIHYRLGVGQLKLGNPEAARVHFEQIPLDHERAASAIRYLAQISFDTENIEHAAFWLSRGRTDFPEDFLDSWVDYALVKVALSQNEYDEVDELLEDAEKKYPPSDYWLTMLQAEIEAHHWKNQTGRLKRK